MKTRKRKVFSSIFLLSSVVASVSILPGIRVLAAQDKGWTIPADAAAEKNPLSSSPGVLKKGESLYKSNCAGCHGPQGRGDGPEVDKKDRASRPANLVMSRNPEGVVFYKIWNGRGEPKMPAFKSRMTKDETWAVVSYVTSSLRSQTPTRE